MALTAESLLKKKKKPKMSKARTKADRVQARKTLGDEPIFNEFQIPTDPSERKMTLIAAWNWYSYFFEQDDWPQVVLDYMASTGKIKAADERAVKALESKELVTFGIPYLKLMRMTFRGWLLDGHERAKVDQALEQIIEAGKARLHQKSRERKAKEKAPVLVAMTTERSRLLEALEELEDKWISGDEPEFNFAEKAQLVNESKHSLKGPVRLWLERRRDELQEVVAKTDDQVNEAYQISRAKAKRRLSWLKDALEQLDLLISTSRRKTRKPRVKAATDQVKKMRFKAEDSETGLKSIQPDQMVGAKMVLIYNTKYRALSLYEAADDTGIKVHRSALVNYKENPRKWKIRKPAQTLTEILGTSSAARVLKIIEGLTTTPRIANGRSNAETILLKAIR